MLDLFLESRLSKRNTINLFIMIMVFSGICGFIYEEIFYYFDLGYLVKRGTTYGPWIPIYFFGGFFITILTYRYKESPLKVFLLSLVITTIIEYLTGFVLDKYFHMRLWDYNTEILNFGNINGYICLRSVSLFAFAGLIIVYCVIPLFIKIIKRVNKNKLNFICTLLITLCIIDKVLYMILN